MIAISPTPRRKPATPIASVISIGTELGLALRSKKRLSAPTSMAEAEVSLRLAFHLLERRLVVSDVHVAIDGAQIRTGSPTHFPIAHFLAAAGFRRKDPQSGWQGAYPKRGVGC